MDIIKKKPIVTDRNPYLEGLIDMHQCIYLPSAHEKNQNLPDYLTQVRLGAGRSQLMISGDSESVSETMRLSLIRLTFQL